MRSFVALGVQMEAEGSKRDDLVMGSAIALEAARVLDFAGLMPRQLHTKEASTSALSSAIYKKDFAAPPSTRCY
jgi:hypothetical protein